MPWIAALVLAALLVIGVGLEQLHRRARNPHVEAANQRLLDELRRQP